jgi:hypothetical protein
MPTHEQHVDSLLFWYGRASEDVKHEGRSWYDAQREMIRELSRAHAIDACTVAAVVAALSPMTRWKENVAGAIRLIRAFEQDRDAAEPPRNCTLFVKNATKAWAIMGGADAADLFATSPKVMAFWRNLCGDEDAVTIDTWMLRSVGEDTAARSGAKAPLVRKVAAAVREAALMVAETPADFQAIVWVQIRREQAWFDTTKEAAA